MARKVLLGVSGGIAAYKACELTRRLRERDCEVQVVMTAGAQQFVSALSFQALSGRSVRSALFDPAAEAAMGHIELARWADVVLVAPASADLMARAAAGMADDLLTTLLLASPAPVAMAPAMNQQMWAHPAVQRNCATLRGDGVRLLGPGVGDQACGDVGAGRMLEPAEILDGIADWLDGSAAPSRAAAAGPLAGRQVLLTAGPTREAIDPVRFISNRSSGRMGFALAEAFARAGAQVTLVHGPGALAVPAAVQGVAVESAAQMHAAVLERVATADIFIGCAAVADYRPAEVAAQKQKKAAQAQTLQLERTPDILADVTARRPELFAVGFAAETEQVEHYARGKLEKKRLALICANQVGTGQGFDVADNTLQVLWAGGQTQLGPAPKTEVATQLVDLITTHYNERA